MNETIISNFKALVEKEQQADKPNTFRIRAYIKVIKILSELKYEITSSNQVKDIPGIGAKTVLKIDNILKTGKLDGLEEFKNTSQPSDKKLLEGITGVGPVKADKLVKDGFNLEKLKSMFKSDISSLHDVLTHHQILGIKYYDDLLQRIPYDEITKVNIYLNKILSDVNKKYYKPTQYQMHICGSYRRMTPNSGDIDVLFYNTHGSETEGPKTESDSDFFTLFLNKLVSSKFLKDHLTDPQKVTTKYMGFCSLPRKKLGRRIDMRCIKYSSLPAAMLYFTGSGEFNKNMRTFALKKGYTINEYGIYKLKSDKTKGDLVEVSSESDIFKILGLEYIEPKDRLSTVNFK
jgi:DNA polymerase beta